MTSFVAETSIGFAPEQCVSDEGPAAFHGLHEHLDYFSEGLAVDIQSPLFEFDDVFNGELAIHDTISSNDSSDSDLPNRTASPTASPAYKYDLESQASPRSVTAVFEVNPLVTVPQPPMFASATEPVAAISARGHTGANFDVNQRKRRHDSFDASSSDDNNSCPEEKRLKQNRESAKRSRQKKKNYVASLEKQVEQLKKENDRLLQMLYHNKSPLCAIDSSGINTFNGASVANPMKAERQRSFRPIHSSSSYMH